MRTELEDTQLVSAAEVIAYLLVGKNPPYLVTKSSMLIVVVWCESRGKKLEFFPYIKTIEFSFLASL